MAALRDLALAEETDGRPSLLEAARLARGWSIAAAIEGMRAWAGILDNEPHLQVDAKEFRRWERGNHIPRTHHVRLLCFLYGATPEQLGLPPIPDILLIPVIGGKLARELLSVDRREFIVRSVRSLAAALSVSAGGSWAEPWDRLAYALREPSRVDAEVIAHLGRVTVSLQQLEREVGPRGVIGPIHGHLDTITALLRGAPPPPLRRQLSSIAGEAFSVAGWVRWNMNDLDEAGANFQKGLEAATEANDRALGAYLVGCLACKPFYRENPSERLQLLEGRTFGFQRSDATPRTQAWLANLEAGGHALSGKRDLYDRAVWQAEELLQRADAEESERRPRIAFFDRPYFAEEQAASLIHLGRPSEARHVLEPLLDGPQAVRERIRLWMLVDLAAVYALEGEGEEAARVGIQALGRAVELRVEPILRCVQGLPDELGGGRQTAAGRELEDRLRDAAILLAS